MRKLSEYILENRIVVDDDLIIEGITIDDKKRTVKLDDSTDGVDFNGPIYWKHDDIDGVSIFKRTSFKKFDKEYDGNPFVYALKSKFGWSFDITKAEAYKYMRKFVDNCNKLQKSYDTIIMIPSDSHVNERFMSALYDIVNAKYKVEKLFRKIELNHDEVEQFIDYEQIRKDFKDPRDVEIELEDLLYDLNESGRKFEAKLVDKRYLKYIKFLQIKHDPSSVDKINDKNILILDDVFSSGATISKAVEAIKQNYMPKSITVVTLLSKKTK